MKRVIKIRAILGSVFLIVGILLYIGAISKYKGQNCICECILKEDFHITAATVKKLQTEEKASLFIQEQEEMVIENRNLSRTTIGTEIAVIGNTGILFPNQAVLNIGDTAQCFISSKTAYELFGTDQLSDATITFQGETYLIVQVIPSDRSLFIHEVSELKRTEGKNSFFSFLYYDISLTNEKDAMDQFLMINGLSGKVWKYMPYKEKIVYLLSTRNTLFQSTYISTQIRKLCGILIFPLGCSIFPFYGMINILSKVGRKKWTFMRNIEKSI